MVLDEPEENEQPVQINGIDVLIPDYVQALVDGTVVDYVKEPRGEGFVLSGPGAAC